jgi:protein TonB
MPDIIDKPVERPDVIPMNENLRPEITYKERPGYTQEARDNGVQGTVVLNVIFEADGTISRIRVVRGLPDGLVERAIEATRKIKFKPAIKDGQPVSVRGNLEYKFTL